MKKKPAKRGQLTIRYDGERQGWIISRKLGPRDPVFATKMDAENFCINKLHQFPIVVQPTAIRHPELPENSVWTGAPWDHTFANLNK